MDAREFLDDLGGPAIYTAPGGEPVAIRAIVRDRGARARMGRGVVLTGEASATVADEVGPQRRGMIEVGGTVYEITGEQLSSVPGLVDLSLRRRSGRRVEAEGIGGDVIDLLGEPVTLSGRTVEAHVQQATSDVSVGEGGMPVETLRTEVSVRIADAVVVRPGDAMVVRGRFGRVRETNRDGHDLIRIMVD